jgi:hypothetical protein
MRAGNFHWSNWTAWFFSLATIPLGFIVFEIARSCIEKGWQNVVYSYLVILFFPGCILGFFYWTLGLRYEWNGEELIEKRPFFRKRVFNLADLSEWQTTAIRGEKFTQFRFSESRKCTINHCSKPNRALIRAVIESGEQKGKTALKRN